MPKGLFLDDERNPQDVTWLQYPENVEWTVVRTFSEFVKVVRTDVFELLSFDHDLQDFSKGSEMTGYDCLKFYCDFIGFHGLKPEYHPVILVHSMNPIGKVNILTYWKNYLENR